MKQTKSQLLPAVLLWLALGTVLAQSKPSALDMARTILDTEQFDIVTDGPHKPSFVGPSGSAKLITYWSSGTDVEKKLLPKGAVKLMTPGSDGKPATVRLSFSAMFKVCSGHSQMAGVSCTMEGFLKSTLRRIAWRSIHTVQLRDTRGVPN
jgi:hypothetical protein